MIAIGADHGGVNLKLAIQEYFDVEGIRYKDFGTNDMSSIDYAPIAAEVAHCVANGEAEQGILCCGTGIGISIAANKVKGIRAAVVTNAFCAQATRQHNDSNILCMGGRVISEVEAVEFVKIFMNTEFEGGRHERRVQQITAIENSEL